MIGNVHAPFVDARITLRDVLCQTPGYTVRLHPRQYEILFTVATPVTYCPKIIKTVSFKTFTLQMKVTVIDKLCNLEDTFDVKLASNGTLMLQQIKQAYITVRPRLLLPNASWLFKKTGLAVIVSKDLLSQYQQHGTDNAYLSAMELMVQCGPFCVQIVESDSVGHVLNLPVTVYCHWSIQRSKEQINDEIVKQSTLNADSMQKRLLRLSDDLVAKSVKLDDKKFVWQYPELMPDPNGPQVLPVVRNSMDNLKVEYTCMSCGAVLALKRYDPIGCPNCAGRIVTKKRQDNGCWYLAR